MWCYSDAFRLTKISRNIASNAPFFSFFPLHSGLWAGSGPTVARLSAGLAIQFMAIDALRDWALTRAAGGGGGRSPVAPGAKQRPAATGLSPSAALFVGGAARALSATATSPITLVKTRMEYAGAGGGSGGQRYRGTLDALRTIARTEGPRGLFRGLGPTVASNAPFSALYYLFYSRLQHRLADAAASGALPVPPPVQNFVAGTTAAVAATLLTQPADMIRTHMQLGLGKGGGVSGPVSALRGVVRERGAAALLAGTGPRVLKRTLQTALVWTLYEELQPRLAAVVSGK